MQNKITIEHKNQYSNEKKNRWGMARDGEEPSIKMICDILSKKLKISDKNISYHRYDEVFFNKYDIADIKDEWIKGTPDYYIKIILANDSYLLFEIKLKSQEYRKTSIGGKTKGGSEITNYGCNSYYLDIVPVLKNMNSFIEKTGIDSKSFVIAFIKDDFSEVMLISLAKINYLIKNGWKKTNQQLLQICKYGEGYGQNAYLIPKDCTINILELSLEDIIKASSSEIVL